MVGYQVIIVVREYNQVLSLYKKKSMYTAREQIFLTKYIE